MKLCDLARGRGWGAGLEVASLTCWARRTLTLEADLDTSLEPGPGGVFSRTIKLMLARQKSSIYLSLKNQLL